MNGLQRMNQRVVTIDDSTAFKLIKLGDGNLSKGIRMATEVACIEKPQMSSKEVYGDKRYT